jgi:hypothetical protein
MGSWKYFGLIGNASLYLFSGYIYFFINIPEQRILNPEKHVEKRGMVKMTCKGTVWQCA